IFAGLYMPRLDWQLWFAGLEYGRNDRSSWERDLQRRILEGSPSVLALLGANPFPDRPPEQVRVRVALYRFATPEQRAQGKWWQRSDAREFLPDMRRRH